MAGIFILLTGIVVISAIFWSKGIDVVPGKKGPDFEFFFRPQRMFLGTWFAQGVFPLWNPHLFAGYPVIESVQPALLYPPRLLCLWFVPDGSRGLMVEVGLHLVLTPLLMAWVLYRGLRFDARSAAGLAIAWSAGPVVVGRYFIGHLTMIFSLTWLPVAVFAVIAACAHDDSLPDEQQANRRLKWWLVASFATAMLLLAGAPQMVYYCVWAQATVAIAAAFPAGWKRTATNLLRLGFAGGMAVALAAPQWLPTALYVPFSSRTSVITNVVSNGMLTAVMMEYLLPAPLGTGLHDFHFLNRAAWDTVTHPGVIMMLLAFAGVAGMFNLRRLFQPGADGPRTVVGSLHSTVRRAAVGLVLLGTLMMAGLTLPGASMFREPTRALVLVVLGTVLLAGLAANVLAKAASDGTMRGHWPFRWRMVPRDAPALQQFCRAAFAGTCLYAILLLACSGALHLWPRQIANKLVLMSDLQSAAWPPMIALLQSIKSDPAALLVVINHSLLLAMGWTLVAGTGFAIARRAPGAALGLLAICMAAAPALQNWPLLVPELRVTETGFPSRIDGELRSAITRARERGERWRISLPQSLGNIAQTIDGLEDAGGGAYDPLAPDARRRPQPESGQTAAHYIGRRYGGEAIRYVMDETVTEDYDFRLQPRRLLSIREVLSTACMVKVSTRFVHLDGRNLSHQYAPLAGDIDIIDEKFREPLARWTGGVDATSTTSAENPGPARVVFEKSQAPHELRFHVTTPASGPALAIVRTTWLPGWTARVDDKPFPVACVNLWMIGVPLPSDGREHVVELTYRPSGWTMSWVVALAGMCGFAAMAGSLVIPRVRKLRAVSH